MKEFLIGSAAIVLAGAAFAQAPTAPTPPAAPHAMPMPAPAPMAMDRAQTRDEVVARVREHFAMMDANKDGVLTREEADAGRAAMKQRLVEKMGDKGERKLRMAPRDPAAAFDRLDTNKDGSISRDEFAKGHELRIERRVELHDGQPGAPAAHGESRGMMTMHRKSGMMGGRMFDMADANKDGRVTLQEATAAAARHFDMADSNRDGKITREERMQMHRQMIEQHRAPKAG